MQEPSSAAPASSLHVPAAHCSQTLSAVAPCLELQRPFAQGVQKKLVEAPSCALHVPAEQFLQESSAVPPAEELHLPLGQASQAVAASAPDQLPGGHLEHASAPALLHWPEPHGAQVPEEFA